MRLKNIFLYVVACIGVVFAPGAEDLQDREDLLIPPCTVTFYSLGGEQALQVHLQEPDFKELGQKFICGSSLDLPRVDSRDLSPSVHEKLQDKFPMNMFFSVSFIAHPSPFSLDLNLVAYTPEVHLQETEDLLKVAIINHQAPYPEFMIYMIQPSRFIVAEPYPTNLYELLACLHLSAQSVRQNVLFYPLLDLKESKDFLRNFRSFQPNIIMHNLNQQQFLNCFMDKYGLDCKNLQASFNGESLLFADIQNPQAIPNYIFSEVFPAPEGNPFVGKGLLEILSAKLPRIKALEVGQETRIRQYVDIIVGCDSKTLTVRKTGPESYELLRDGVVLCGFRY